MLSSTEEKRLKRNAYMRAWKKKNPDKHNSYERNLYRKSTKMKDRQQRNLQGWRCDNYDRELLRYAQRSASRKNLPFNLEISDIVIPEVCPVLGIPIVLPEIGGRRRYSGAPSLDRKDNNLGYIKGNVFVVSWRANRLKNDSTLAELEALVRYMRGF